MEGRITFVNGAPGDGVIYQLVGVFEDHWYAQQIAMSAALRNADSSYVYTFDADAGDTYIYHEGEWQRPLTTNAEKPVVSTAHAQLIMREGTIYVQAPDQRFYTLLGLPIESIK